MYSAPVSERYRAVGAGALDRMRHANRLGAETRHAIRVVSEVLPFRVNSHILSTLVDWDAAPDDPLFRLVFPARKMLSDDDFTRMEALIESGASRDAIQAEARRIRARLNPHPAGQRESNVPQLDGHSMPGLQHKYRETVLYFPARGQTCHAYCTFCFRWAQFVGDKSLKFANKEIEEFGNYLQRHPDVTDVLVTGGDPLIMSTRHLSAIVDRLLKPELEHIRNIRFGTKSLTFWPQRFVSDEDADDLLRLVERISQSGRNVAIMAHINHWREIDNSIAHRAIRRLRAAGATINSQAPLLRDINDSSDVWVRNWNDQVRLGIHPYYMFIERDTGPRHYFEVPLARALSIYRSAIQQVSGLARTARGPVMSAHPGKVEVLDVTQSGDEALFLLQFLQAREGTKARRPFFATGRADASWYDQLKPLEGLDVATMSGDGSLLSMPQERRHA